MPLPQLIRVRQRFERPVVDSIEGSVDDSLARLNLSDRIGFNDSVAVTAGSRGIANIAQITKAIVQFIKSLGGQPFIVPAMGSHGGATADGQLAVLKTLGITEASCQCPIRSSTATAVIGQSTSGFPVFADQIALSANHVILVNRVKPHTSIAGELESGLMKMLLVGLGNRDGAGTFHKALASFSFDQIVEDVGQWALERFNILAGVAIVENALDQTAIIEAMVKDEIITKEKQLLDRAKQLMARLPFDTIDLLLVDEIGKNVSGTGMDTNVIGRKSNDRQAVGSETPRVKRICVRSLTKETAGNATGIGLAEFCHSRLLKQIDRQATNVNCITSLHPGAGMLPISFDSDRHMLEAALDTIGLTPPEQARVVWIRNTLDLEEFACSTAFIDQISADQRVEILDPNVSFDFDANGDLAGVEQALNRGANPGERR